MPGHKGSLLYGCCVMMCFMEPSEEAKHPRRPDIFTETHVLGDDTHVLTVRAEHCDALAARHIAHVAVVDAASPYTIVRTHLSGAFMQVCLGGEGHTFLDGRWLAHTPGYASFAPAHVLHAFHCLPAKRWQLCWVRFMPTSPRSLAGAITPSLTRFDGRPLENAVRGLYHEMATTADPGTSAIWVDIIDRYVTRMVDPWQSEPRLNGMWKVVLADLGRPWQLDELASLANISSEHLRRLCWQNFGRSPGRQLTAMRMAQAAHALATTQRKIEAIARDVGYANPFAFSNTFKRLTGFRPSEYRSRPRS